MDCSDSKVTYVPPRYHTHIPSATTDNDPAPEHFEDDLISWHMLTAGISKLRSLRSLCICLDHTSTAIWSYVNERDVLSQFEELSSTSQLDLSIDLPKLHPKFENSQRHYIGDEVVPDECCTCLLPFKIRRVLRQRYQAKRMVEGRYHSSFAQDFPYFLGHCAFPKTSRIDTEKMERVWWQQGVDVRALHNSLWAVPED